MSPLELALARAIEPRVPMTPAGRLDFVQELLAPVDPDTGELREPLVTDEEAKSLLDFDLTRADLATRLVQIFGVEFAEKLVTEPGWPS